HHISALNPFTRNFNIDSVSAMAVRKKSQKRFAHLSEPDDQYDVVTHEFSSCASRPEQLLLMSVLNQPCGIGLGKRDRFRRRAQHLHHPPLARSRTTKSIAHVCLACSGRDSICS